MTGRRHTPLALLLAGSLLAACGGYDPPEEADPADSAYPTPTDTTLVPGAAQPGPQNLEPEERRE